MKGKKGQFSFLTKPILTLILIVVCLIIFFWPNGLYAKTRDFIKGDVKPIDETMIKGAITEEDGIVYSPKIDASAKLQFRNLVNAFNPPQLETTCLSLMPFPDKQVFTNVRGSWKTDEPYKVEFEQVNNGRVIRLYTPENRIVARIFQEGYIPCVVAGKQKTDRGSATVAKNFKACLDQDLESCEPPLFKEVDKITIKGKELEKLEIPDISIETLENKFLKYRDQDVWILLKSGKDTCFISTSGNNEGNDQGIDEDKIKDYLEKTAQPKICDFCQYGNCPLYKNEEECLGDATTCKFGCTPNAEHVSDNYEVCVSCETVKRCEDYNYEKACVQDRCHKNSCNPTDKGGLACVTCASCDLLPMDLCEENPCGFTCERGKDAAGSNVCVEKAVEESG